MKDTSKINKINSHSFFRADKNLNLPVCGINFVRNAATANSTDDMSCTYDDTDWLLALCCCCCLLNVTAHTYPQAALTSQSTVKANYSSVPFFAVYTSNKSTVNIAWTCHFIPGYDLSMLNDDTSSSVTKPYVFYWSPYFLICFLALLAFSDHTWPFAIRDSLSSACRTASTIIFLFVVAGPFKVAQGWSGLHSPAYLWLSSSSFALTSRLETTSIIFPTNYSSSLYHFIQVNEKFSF